MKLIILIFCLFYSWKEVAFAQRNYDLEPVQIWDESYQESLRQVHPVNRVTKKNIQEASPVDLTRLMKSQTGVQIQEEDSWGLRTNIGLRGTPPHRSRKVSFYEDGVLIGPAPYSAPAAYYNPYISRLDGIEIYKGLSSVLYGPNTIGGAIDYRTKSFSELPTFLNQFSYGSFDTKKYHIFSSTGQNKPHSFLIVGENLKSEGFKKLESGAFTGFEKTDFLLKYAYQFKSQPIQLRFKLGWSQEDSNETYLGLSESDFSRDGFYRYIASEKDNMKFEHLQGSVGWYHFLDSGHEYSLQIYRNQFSRNWQRLNGFSSSLAPSIDAVLRNPAHINNIDYYDLLRGEINSSDLSSINLVRANNQRNYLSEGIQWASEHPFDKLNKHKVKIIARVHEDFIKRNHTEDDFSMENKNLNLVTSGRTADQDKDSAQAKSLAMEYKGDINSSLIVLSGRWEEVAYQSEDYITNLISTREDRVFTPGIGYLYRIHNDWSLFSSLNQGVTLVGPQGLPNETPELSLNSELGFRYYNSANLFFTEALYFQSSYTNMKGLCSFSSGCQQDTGTSFQGGSALVQGIEFKFHSFFQKWNYKIPLEMNLTWMRAAFTQNFQTNNPEWGHGQNVNIYEGDPLPYVPNLSTSFRLGFEKKNWSNFFSFQYTGLQYDQSAQQERREIPASFYVDWYYKYRWKANHEFELKVDNIFNKTYLVSYRPFGARPGKPQSFLFSYQYAF